MPLAHLSNIFYGYWLDQALSTSVLIIDLVVNYSYFFDSKDLLDDEDENQVIFHSYPGSTSSLVNDWLRRMFYLQLGK